MTPADENFIFRFGKHKGKSLGKVLEIDPNYIVWCFDNLTWFDVEADLLDKAGMHEFDREFAHTACEILFAYDPYDMSLDEAAELYNEQQRKQKR